MRTARCSTSTARLTDERSRMIQAGEVDAPISSAPTHPRRQSGEFFDLGSEFSASIASVDDCAGLEQEHRCFGIGARTVLDAAGDDEELSRPEHHIAASHLNGQLSVQDQEELV